MERDDRSRTYYGGHRSRESDFANDQFGRSEEFASRSVFGRPAPGSSTLRHSKYRLTHENEYDQEHNYYDNFRDNQVKLSNLRKNYGIPNYNQSVGTHGGYSPVGSSFGLGYGNMNSGHFVDNGGDY